MTTKPQFFCMDCGELSAAEVSGQFCRRCGEKILIQESNLDVTQMTQTKPTEQRESLHKRAPLLFEQMRKAIQ